MIKIKIIILYYFSYKSDTLMVSPQHPSIVIILADQQPVGR